VCGTTISDEKLVAAEAHFQANKVTPSSFAAASAATINVSIFNRHINLLLTGHCFRCTSMSFKRTRLSQEATSREHSFYHWSNNCYQLHFVLTKSDSQIANQIAVMNKAYANAGITWVLAGTDRTTNANWFNTVGPDATVQTTMKNTLRKGTAKDLNVYTVGYVSRLHHSRLFNIILQVLSRDLVPVFSDIQLSLQTTLALRKMTAVSFFSLLFQVAHLLRTI